MAAPWSDVISLVALEEGLNENGFPDIIEGEPREVFANRLEVYTNEHYQAKQSGVTIEYKFEIRAVEYEGEELVKFNEEDYDVERRFEKNEFVELTLKRKSDDHGI
jgi:SPP1 family predicted phage head-tail adaptor